jgi:hypothetical protein
VPVGVQRRDGKRPYAFTRAVDRSPAAAGAHDRAAGWLVVVGTTVIRELELELTMTSRRTLPVPAYLRYDLVFAEDELEIVRLQAFWELRAMICQFVRSGAR